MQPSSLFSRLARGLFALVAVGAASIAFAQTAPREGVDYRIVKPVQETHAPAGKVEVIEFFGYWCPHCNDFEPTMRDWAKRNEAKIETVYVPIAFQPSMANLQKLYYTLDLMGEEKKLRAKVFSSIHGDRSIAPNAGAGELADWASKNGLDKQKFLDTYNSFSVQSKVNRANQIATAYGVDAVPLLGVGGKYLVSIDARKIANADYFVDQALKAK